MLISFTLVVARSMVLVVLIFFSGLDYFVEFEQVMRLALLCASRTNFDNLHSPANWCYYAPTAVCCSKLCSRANCREKLPLRNAGRVP